jgi:hypothetical protein
VLDSVFPLQTGVGADGRLQLLNASGAGCCSILH